MKKTTIKKTVLCIAAVLVLIVPDIQMSIGNGFFSFCSIILSKIFLFLFLFLLLLRLTHSFFYSYLILGIPYVISSMVEIVCIFLLNSYVTEDNLKGFFCTTSGELIEFLQKFYLYLLAPVAVLVLFILILLGIKKLFSQPIKKRFLIPAASMFLVISLSISAIRVYSSELEYRRFNIPKYILYQKVILQHPFGFYYGSYVFGAIKIKGIKYKKIKSRFTFDVSNPNDTINPELVVLVV